MLQHWGELEVYDVRVATLRAVAGSGARPEAVALSTEWLAACTTSDGTQHDRLIAGDVRRWERLLQLCPEVLGGARPDCLPKEQWNFLHLLPYVIWMWPATPWGCTPRGQLGHHFLDQPVVQRLCEWGQQQQVASIGYTCRKPGRPECSGSPSRSQRQPQIISEYGYISATPSRASTSDTGNEC
jgi:hypothetical protein